MRWFLMLGSCAMYTVSDSCIENSFRFVRLAGVSASWFQASRPGNMGVSFCLAGQVCRSNPLRSKYINALNNLIGMEQVA